MANGIREVLQQASKNLSEQTLGLINTDLKRYKKDVDEILGKLRQWNSRLSSKNKELYLKTAYQRIMEFRNYLLGKENEIQYRLYIRETKNDDLTDTQIVNINEKQLMTVVTRDRNSLRLKKNLDAVKKEQFNDFKRQQIFNKHMGNIAKGLEHPGGETEYYTVTQSVIQRYAKVHQRNENGNLLAIGLSNLAYQDDSVKGKSAYTLKLFNRGWIYQAFDATVEDFDSKKQNLEVVSLDVFHKKYFTESLDFDNLVGFKGGDVGLMQIKANAAAIMSKTTLVKYLTIIQNALNQKINGQNSASKEELTRYLISQFKEGKIEDSLYNYAAKHVQDLIKNLTN